MNLRSWLYSPSGLFWPFVVLLLPSGLVMVGLALIVFLPRGDNPLGLRVIAGLMVVGQVFCWTAHSRVVHHRVGKGGRRVWLVVLAVCILIGLVALPFGIFVLANGQAWGVLAVLPVLGAVWLFLLVHRAPHWQPQPVPAIYQRRKKWFDWICPRPYPDDSCNGKQNSTGLFGVILMVAIGLVAAGVAGYAVVTGDLLIPSKRGTTHIHGPAVWPLAASYICFFMVTLSTLCEYRDKQPDLYLYRIFRWWVGVTGWRLFFWGNIFNVFLFLATSNK